MLVLKSAKNQNRHDRHPKNAIILQRGWQVGTRLVTVVLLHLSPMMRNHPMTLSEFYDEVSRNVDTDKTKINVAETKRVLSEAFLLLQSYDSATTADLVSKGLAAAKKKATTPAKK